MTTLEVEIPARPFNSAAMKRNADEDESGPGILSILWSGIPAPYPNLPPKFIKIKTEDMKFYFSYLYFSLVDVLYSYTAIPAHVISEENFILVCRYLTKSRIDHVYSSVSGKRLTSRIHSPYGLDIPKSLADIINGIGVVEGQGGALRLIPAPEEDSSEPQKYLLNLVGQAELEGFSCLTKMCTSSTNIQQYIRTGTISSVLDGTPWWAISARKVEDSKMNAVNNDACMVVPCFKEFTQTDALMCAIVQRNNTGLEEHIDISFKWRIGSIVGISSIRSAFNIGA